MTKPKWCFTNLNLEISLSKIGNVVYQLLRLFKHWPSPTGNRHRPHWVELIGNGGSQWDQWQLLVSKSSKSKRLVQWSTEGFDNLRKNNWLTPYFLEFSSPPYNPRYQIWSLLSPKPKKKKIKLLPLSFQKREREREVIQDVDLNHFG